MLTKDRHNSWMLSLLTDASGEVDQALAVPGWEGRINVKRRIPVLCCNAPCANSLTESENTRKSYVMFYSVMLHVQSLLPLEEVTLIFSD